MGKGKSNLTPKIFSVIIAIILWSYVMGIENPEWPKEIKNVDVEFINRHALERENLVVMDPNEVKVNVSVTGRKSDMDNFDTNNIVARLDLSGYREGQTRIPIVVTLKGSTSTVRVTKWEPSDVLVNIDSIVTEPKVVNIRTEGKVSDDYVIGDLVANPRTILLRGPRSWVNQVSEVFAVVPIGGRTATANITAMVQIQDHTGNDVVGLEKDPSVVEVNIPIYRKATLPIEVILENELPEDYVVSEMNIIPSSITIKGGNNVADLSSIHTEPIDVNLFLENPSLEVELDLLENIELLDPNQRVVVNAKIEQIETKEFEFAFNEIDIRNLDEDILLEGNNGTIKLVVKGTESALDTITKDILKPYIDLNNFSEGQFDIDIRVDSIEGVTVESIEPETLTINLISR